MERLSLSGKFSSSGPRFFSSFFPIMTSPQLFSFTTYPHTPTYFVLPPSSPFPPSPPHTSLFPTFTTTPLPSTSGSLQPTILVPFPLWQRLSPPRLSCIKARWRSGDSTWRIYHDHLFDLIIIYSHWCNENMWYNHCQGIILMWSIPLWWAYCDLVIVTGSLVCDYCHVKSSDRNDVIIWCNHYYVIIGLLCDNFYLMRWDQCHVIILIFDVNKTV